MIPLRHVETAIVLCFQSLSCQRVTPAGEGRRDQIRAYFQWFAPPVRHAGALPKRGGWASYNLPIGGAVSVRVRDGIWRNRRSGARTRTRGTSYHQPAICIVVVRQGLLHRSRPRRCFLPGSHPVRHSRTRLAQARHRAWRWFFISGLPPESRLMKARIG
jgi:hypothetical protein